MSPSVGLLILALRAVSLVKAEYHEPVTVLFEKKADAYGDGFEKICRKRHTEPQGFACFQGNVSDESNLVYFHLQNLPKGAGESDRMKAEIYLKITDPLSEHPFLLSVYDAMTKKKVAHARVIPGVTRKWIVLDVSDIVRHWLRYPNSNRGFTAAYEATDQTKFSIEENRSKLGLPLLVIYREYYRVPPRQAERNRRSPEQPPAKENISSPAADKLACSRRDLHINTRQLLGDRVLQPTTFNAYDCGGKCEPPFHSRILFKNHAYWKYLNYLANNNSSSKPAEYCCVPSAYKSLYILFHDKTSGNFIIEKFPNGIVTECSCTLI